MGPHCVSRLWAPRERVVTHLNAFSEYELHRYRMGVHMHVLAYLSRKQAHVERFPGITTQRQAARQCEASHGEN